MSRFIDADKLNDYFWDNRSKLFASKDCRVAVDKQPTVNAIVIPKGASNLDMLKAVFPNIKITYSKYDVEGTPHIIMAHGMDGVTSFTADWANAPYESEDKE